MGTKATRPYSTDTAAHRSSMSGPQVYGYFRYQIGLSRALLKDSAYLTL